MILNNQFLIMWILVLQRMTIEFLFDLIYFPVWWYTGGVKHAFKYCIHLFKSGNANLAPGLWLKNILVPMFGQSDFQGRLVSFFMRLANVFFRSLLLLFWLLIVILVFIFWIAFPLFIVMMIINSFF